MNTKELRADFNLSQSELAVKFNIPIRTVQNWDLRDCCPDYVFTLMTRALYYEKELNHLKSLR